MEIHKQFVRYAIVGLVSNAVLYVLYLLATSLGLGHKTAMTLLYAVGILQTFLLNRRWTFNHRGCIPHAFVRYIVIYGLGYVFNLGALFVFVDKFGFPHQIVQGVLIFAIAVFLFILQRIWVFNDEERQLRYYATQKRHFKI